eukprot:6487694-Amphidinium_carterae.2
MNNPCNIRGHNHLCGENSCGRHRASGWKVHSLEHGVARTCSVTKHAAGVQPAEPQFWADVTYHATSHIHT